MRRTRVLAGLAILALVIAAPAGLTGAYGQSNGKPAVAVGSKAFTEQLIVGNMVALLLESKGYPVTRKLGLGRPRSRTPRS